MRAQGVCIAVFPVEHCNLIHALDSRRGVLSDVWGPNAFEH